MADTIADARVANMIKQNEGWSDVIYKDTKGNSTIGNGFNISDPAIRKFFPQDVLSGKRKLTQQEADTIYYTKILPMAKADAAAFVGQPVYNTLQPMQQAALTDMSFHMGGPRLNGFKNMRAAIQKGDFDGASREMLNSNYAREFPERAQRNALYIRGAKK